MDDWVRAIGPLSQPLQTPEQVFIAQGLGACLTQANLEDIKRFVEDFAVRALLPAMEARVRALNHQVSTPTLPTFTNMTAARVSHLEPCMGAAHHVDGQTAL